MCVCVKSYTQILIMIDLLANVGGRANSGAGELLTELVEANLCDWP